MSIEPAAPTNRAKVFWFFFSKKNCFLDLATLARPSNVQMRLPWPITAAPFALSSVSVVMRLLNRSEIVGSTSRLQRLTAPCKELPNSKANGHLDDRQIKGNDQPRCSVYIAYCAGTDITNSA